VPTCHETRRPPALKPCEIIAATTKPRQQLGKSRYNFWRFEPLHRKRIASVLNILVLCKRRYTNRDLIGERYGRLYHLPAELAARGHRVDVLCLDYPWNKRTKRDRDEEGVAWHSHAFPWGALSFSGRAVRMGRRMQANLVLGMADSIYGVWAESVARKLGCSYAFDLYDNFETFTNIKLPGMSAKYRSALQNASVLSCVSDHLKDYIKDRYSPSGGLVTVPNYVDGTVFRPLNKQECREALGLPQQVPLVGFFGAIDHDRGINELFRGWEEVREKRPDAWLILAGKVGSNVRLPGTESQVRYLGLLPFDRMPACINACDVVTVFNIDSPFGRHCFPQKLCEYMACGVPIVATDVGAVSEFLRSWPCCKYAQGRTEQFAERTLAFINGLKVDYGRVPTWSDVVVSWEELLIESVERRVSPKACGPRAALARQGRTG